MKNVKESEIINVYVQFKSTDGDITGNNLEIPLATTTKQLNQLLNQLLKNDEKLPYSFYLNDLDNEIKTDDTLDDVVLRSKTSTEIILPILYQPQAIFRVQTVTRCSSSLNGHTEAVLSVHFSPNGKELASGSGDSTVRIWDILTETPKHTFRGHNGWVLAVSWSPLGNYVASGGMDDKLIIWDISTGKKKCKPFIGHRKAITCLAWQPYMSDPDESKIASGSKDGIVKIWNIKNRQCLYSLSSHTAAIRDLKWGGVGLIYTASQDRTIKVWEASSGKLIRNLEGHAHWVNNISLNTEAALRLGPYNHRGECANNKEEMIQYALNSYKKIFDKQSEMLCSGSDDFTAFLWNPTKTKKPILRMTGHQQPINFIAYSPDGRYIATASFDNSVRLWNGQTGKFIKTLRGHVQSVYQLAWSADSRLLCSSSQDSTLKIWELRTNTMKIELPGHADEVYAVDWGPDGKKVVSGGKDCVLKIWSR